jgi:minor histocompatibility antigen H13
MHLSKPFASFSSTTLNSNMSDPGLAAQLVGRLAYEFAQIQPMLPTYTLITLAAIFPIYVGAHASLSCPSSAVRALKRDGKRTQPGEVDDGDSETESDARMEGMSPSDAIFFPLIAGVMLSALYLLIQYLDDPEVLNKILNWYFAIVGLYSVSKSISDALRLAHRFVFPACYSQGLRVWVVDAAARLVKSKMSTDPETQLRRQPVPGLLAALPYPAFVNNFLWSVRELPSKKLLFKFYIERVASGQFKADVFNGLGVTAALCATAYFNLVDRPWWLTNLMGFAFAYSSLQFISPTTFVTGALVLLGLFCYDIYMVFFT